MGAVVFAGLCFAAGLVFAAAWSAHFAGDRGWRNTFAFGAALILAMAIWTV